MKVGELITVLSDLDPDWDVIIGYEGTTGDFEGVNTYPEGLKREPASIEYRKQCYRDAGQEVPDPLPEVVRFLIEPETVVLWTY